MTKCQPLKKIWELFLLKLQATPTSPDLPFQICCAIPKNLKLRRDLPDSWRADVLMCSRCVQKSLFTDRSAHYLATGNLRSLCYADINLIRSIWQISLPREEVSSRSTCNLLATKMTDCSVQKSFFTACWLTTQLRHRKFTFTMFHQHLKYLHDLIHITYYINFGFPEKSPILVTLKVTKTTGWRHTWA